MIKFFRRIRLKLIDEGNLKKYLVYAIGEILLVMIGILLALQVNNWNNIKEENIQAKKVLVALNSEFELTFIDDIWLSLKYSNSRSTLFDTSIVDK